MYLIKGQVTCEQYTWAKVRHFCDGENVILVFVLDTEQHDLDNYRLNILSNNNFFYNGQLTMQYLSYQNLVPNISNDEVIKVKYPSLVVEYRTMKANSSSSDETV